MRLRSISVAGLRGFASPETIDLDAAAIVVVAANGSGKTSLFDAILWAISGTIPRLGDPSPVVSMYSDTGQARVELKLRGEVDDEYVITRSFDGSASRVAVRDSQRTYDGAAADARIIDLLWPLAATAPNGRESLAGLVTRNIYLQQDLIRQFVEATTENARFAAVSELLGAGRIAELQSSLETAKRAWSRFTNVKSEESEALKDRLTALASKISGVPENYQGSQGFSREKLSLWLGVVEREGAARSGVDSDKSATSLSLDGAIKQIEATRLALERRLQTLRGIETDVVADAETLAPNIEALRNTVDVSKEKYALVQRKVVAEQARLTELRALRTMLAEKSEQLRVLASLALHHLGELCPVCAQTYDRDATQRRLRQLALAGEGEPIPHDEHLLRELLAELATAEIEAAADDTALRAAVRSDVERTARAKSITSRLGELGIHEGDDRRAAVTAEITETVRRLERMVDLIAQGEVLALNLATVSSAGRVDETRREVAKLRQELETLDNDVAARMKTGNLAQRVIEALRESVSGVVGERLREITPLFQSIYSRIDPHPAFRAVSFISRVVRGRGELSTVVRDPIQNKESEKPGEVLSSSQLNALAVCVFLALNLGINKLPLDVTILDDPLQSLDDVNLLGLVDLLRRTKDMRQLIVSTHDRRFGDLLARKLRPIDEGARTIVVELSGWTRVGPRVLSRDIPADVGPLRLVAS